MKTQFFLILALLINITIWGHLSNAKNKTTPYSTSLSANMSRGVDELEHTYGNLGLGISYSFTKNLSMSGNISYYNEFTKYEEPGIRGFEDLLLILNHKTYKSSTGDFSLGTNLTLTLPSSKTSRDASLRFGISGGIVMDKKINNRLNINYTSQAGYLNHEYETMDKSGSAQNPHFIIKNSLALRLKILKSLSWFTNGSFVTYWDYGNSQVDINLIKTQINWKLTSDTSTFLQYSWKNKVVSNYSLFDDENVKIIVGATFML